MKVAAIPLAAPVRLSLRLTDREVPAIWPGAAPAPSPRPIPGVRNDMEVMESKAEPPFGSRAPRDGRDRAARYKRSDAVARESDDRLIQFRRERWRESETRQISRQLLSPRWSLRRIKATAAKTGDRSRVNRRAISFLRRTERISIRRFIRARVRSDDGSEESRGQISGYPGERGATRSNRNNSKSGGATASSLSPDIDSVAACGFGGERERHARA
jgi:hypothetical protein